jgi:hypothetical protein
MIIHLHLDGDDFKEVLKAERIRLVSFHRNRVNDSTYLEIEADEEELLYLVIKYGEERVWS